MIEILVVMALITFLVSMVVVVVGRTFENAKITATTATLTKVQSLIEQRRKALTRYKFDKETNFLRSQYPTASSELIEIIARKEVYRSLFPQQTLDLYGPDRTANTADDSALYTLLTEWQSSGRYNQANHNRISESSELLYLALTEGSVVDQTLDTDVFEGSELADTDNDGLMEIVDGWGRPLQFYRWSTRLIRPAASGSENTPQRLSSGATPPQGQYTFPVNPTFSGILTALPTTVVSPQITQEEAVGLGANMVLGSLPPLPLIPTGDEDTNGNCVLDSGEDRNGNGLLDTARRGTNTYICQERLDPLAKDADDPNGLLRFVGDIDGDNNQDANENWIAGSQVAEQLFHTPETFTVPLIVSAGPDGILGLLLPINEDGNLNGTLDPGEDINGNGILDQSGHLAQPNWANIRNMTDDISNRTIQDGGN